MISRGGTRWRIWRQRYPPFALEGAIKGDQAFVDHSFAGERCILDMHKDKLHSRFRFSRRIPSPRDMSSLDTCFSLSFSLSLSFSYWSSPSLSSKVSHEAARWKYRGLNGGETMSVQNCFRLSYFLSFFSEKSS